MVAGPPGCGRTQALGTIALALAATHDPARIQLGMIGAGREHEPLAALEKLPHMRWWVALGQRMDGLLADLEGELEMRTQEMHAEGQLSAQLVLFVDDYPSISSRMQPAQINRLEAIGNRGAALGVTFVISMPSGALSGIGDSLVRRLKMARTGLWLVSTHYGDASAVGVTIPVHLRGKHFPPGRGFLYHPGGQTLLQVAYASLDRDVERAGGDIRSMADWVAEIQQAALLEGKGL